MKKFIVTIIALTIALQSRSQTQSLTNMNTLPANTILYKTLRIDSLDIFYREGGVQNKEVILFLHGFPTSSHMFRNILPILAEKYHVIAPDYPGFGFSSTPSLTEFEYTFDNLASVMESFIDNLNLEKINLYVQDYGGPIGYRITTKRPELIKSLIIQNANAYEEGFGPDVKKIGDLIHAKNYAGLDDAINYMLSYAGIKEQYTHGALDVKRVSPDAYNMDHYFMERLGIKAIQMALFKNYATNFPKYPEWQGYFRREQPRTLIIWGKNDKIFIAPGAQAYLRDLKDAELHLLDGGHFVLEEHYHQAAILIDRFLQVKH